MRRRGVGEGFQVPKVTIIRCKLPKHISASEMGRGSLAEISGDVDDHYGCDYDDDCIGEHQQKCYWPLTSPVWPQIQWKRRDTQMWRYGYFEAANEAIHISFWLIYSRRPACKNAIQAARSRKAEEQQLTKTRYRYGEINSSTISSRLFLFQIFVCPFLFLFFLTRLSLTCKVT